MNTFNQWNQLHDAGNLFAFNGEPEGILWLKLKSLIRPVFIKKLISQLNIDLQGKRIKEQFVELFDILSRNMTESHQRLDTFIRKEAIEQSRRIDTSKLISELFKVQSFDWGGDYRNSLDKYLVSRYVKQVMSYTEIVSKLDTEISTAVKGYLINSWYNHWSSIIIEDVFKRHPAVLPTVGKIKNVDFFINEIPFDLKVAYFPNEFLKQRFREKAYPQEEAYLKKAAKALQIKYHCSADPSYEIMERLKDRNTLESKSVLTTLHERRVEIVKESMEAPRPLIKWLYENQGEMRFSSENRLFLVLIDLTDFSHSWKLKRNLDALKPAIDTALDRFATRDLTTLEVSFQYPGKAGSFSALADIIFIVRR